MALLKSQLSMIDTDNCPSAGDAPAEQAGAAARVLYVERLYHEYRVSLTAYVARLLPGGQQDVEVIIQDTYVRLLRQRDLGHLQQNPRAYIFTIATNLVRDALRRHMRRFGDAHDELKEEEHVCTSGSPPQNVQWQQSLQRLQAALLQLKPATRQVFLLSRYEEMTYPEIAEAMGMSTRTVERHMSHAFKHLQKTLEDIL